LSTFNTALAERETSRTPWRLSTGKDVKQFNVYLSTDLIRELKHHAVDTGQSLSGLVTDALCQYLAKAARRAVGRVFGRGGVREFDLHHGGGCIVVPGKPNTMEEFP